MAKKTEKPVKKKTLKIPKVVVRDLEPRESDQKNITGGSTYRSVQYQP